MCTVGAEEGNERHEFLEDITREASLRIKTGGISPMKNFLPRWRQYFFKPFGILEHLEAPRILESVCSHQVKKPKQNREERKFAALHTVFLYMESETFGISAYSLRDAENSKHFSIFVPGEFQWDKSTNFTSILWWWRNKVHTVSQVALKNICCKPLLWVFNSVYNRYMSHTVHNILNWQQDCIPKQCSFFAERQSTKAKFSIKNLNAFISILLKILSVFHGYRVTNGNENSEDLL